MARSSGIAIVGGGPGGLMLARRLQSAGAPVVVYERDPNAAFRLQGGSLDLHADTGQRALREAGLEAAFLAHARPEDQGDRLYAPNGEILFDHPGDGFDRPEIDRTALRSILLDSLDAGTVRWGAQVTDIRERPGGTWEVITQDGATIHEVVVGADGAWSRVRPLLSDAVPIYEGVAFLELGFEATTHRNVDDLTGSGKMFAVGDNRALVAQRNGHGHIRGYAGWRMPEAEASALAEQDAAQVRADAMQAFAGWAPGLTAMIRDGELLGVRPLFALPAGHSWRSRPGLTLLGDAAHLMSPFAGEGVNLALVDAADLAAALTGGQAWAEVTRAEEVIAARAKVAAEDSAQGLRATFSPEGAARVLEHYRMRIGSQAHA